MVKPTLLVLAAGMGSRYGGLKQIDPVGPSGEAIIDYSIYDALRAGFGKIVFVIRKDIDKEFKASFGDKFSRQIPVEYVYQELGNVPDGLAYTPERVKPWGTGHAVLCSAPAIDEPFAVINADDFYGPKAYQELFAYLSQLENEHTNHCMVGYRLENTLSDHGYVSRGICQSDGAGWLTNVIERTHIEKKNDQIFFQDHHQEAFPLSPDAIVSMNMWGFTPSIFDQHQHQFVDFIQEHGQNPKAEFYIPTVVNTMIKRNEGKVKVLTSGDKWFGVTYKEDKPIVEQNLLVLIDKGIYPSKLWA